MKICLIKRKTENSWRSDENKGRQLLMAGDASGWGADVIPQILRQVLRRLKFDKSSISLLFSN